MASAVGCHIPSGGLHNCLCSLHSFWVSSRADTVYYGHEFNRSLYKTFYDLHIEDMWLPFFCNTANITTSRMEIHETGYAWRFIRKPWIFCMSALNPRHPQGLRCRLWALYLLSVITATCLWTEDIVSSLHDVVIEWASYFRPFSG